MEVRSLTSTPSSSRPCGRATLLGSGHPSRPKAEEGREQLDTAAVIHRMRLVTLTWVGVALTHPRRYRLPPGGRGGRSADVTNQQKDHFG